jgi:hypothetical protein
VSELLQRPVLSSNGYVAAFESTAANLTDSASTQTHVFLRFMAPPIAAFNSEPPVHTNSDRIEVSVHADDPAASLFLCQLDAYTPVIVAPGRSCSLIYRRADMSCRSGQEVPACSTSRSL